MNKDKIDNAFVEKHLGLVHSLANRFRGRGIDYEELYSAACMGLVKAANNFDEERGLQFSTYAVPVILGEIKQLFRDGGTVKVSRSLKELSLKATRIQEQFIKDGKEPRISDIAQALGVSIAEASQALTVSMPAMSLTDNDEDSDGGQFDLPVEAPQIQVTELLALKQSLSRLEPLDRRLIILRYWGGKTQAEVASLLGMTQVQISRREKKIIGFLREEMLC